MSHPLDPRRWLIADWPAPAQVYAGTTLRTGGVSQAPYDSLNLALHVGDDPVAVMENRGRLGLPTEPSWLEQVHGCSVIEARPGANKVIQADAAYTASAGVICAVMTADCLPVLLCDRLGSRVAAVHVGWRGLAAGVLEAAVAKLGGHGSDLLVWLGPAIGPGSYEVGNEVRTAFVSQDAHSDRAFHAGRNGHWWMDIYTLARQRLANVGVTGVYGGDHDTCRDAEHFFSYRRDGVTGRMASIIWFESNGI